MTGVSLKPSEATGMNALSGVGKQASGKATPDRLNYRQIFKKLKRVLWRRKGKSCSEGAAGAKPE